MARFSAIDAAVASSSSARLAACARPPRSYDPVIPQRQGTTMEPRLDLYKASPEAIKLMLAFSAGTEKLGLEHSLLELVKLRASQVNGCAFCVDMHAADARKGGETERRLYAVP